MHPSVVVAVVVYAGRTLLVRRHDDGSGLSWQFPSGEQEPGETPSQAAVREVAEEVGLTVVPVALLGERAHPVTGRHAVYVACDAEGPAAHLVDTAELAELRWCDASALAERIPTGVFAPVAEYLSRRLGP